MKVSLIGAGDIEYHYSGLLGLTAEKLEKEKKDIAKVLAETHSEIVLLPDRGMPFEITKAYKQFGGKKAIGTVPLSDKDFGIAHLQKYIEHKEDGKKVFDEIIDTGNWYKQDLTCCLYADTILLLGISTGSLGELAYAYYLYKLFKGKKPEVKSESKKIHSKIVAGEKVPFSVIVYKPFVKDNLPYELEKYIEKFEGKVFYANNSKELKSAIESLTCG